MMFTRLKNVVILHREDAVSLALRQFLAQMHVVFEELTCGITTMMVSHATIC